MTNRNKSVRYFLAGNGAAQPYSRMRECLNAARAMARHFPDSTIQIRMVVTCGDQTTRHVIWDSDRLHPDCMQFNLRVHPA